MQGKAAIVQQFFGKNAQKRRDARKRHRYYWDDISRTLDYFIHAEDSVLEIGCGGGELLGYLKAADKTGIDFSAEMLDLARKSFPDIRFEQMTAEEFTLDRKFDVIVLSNLIGYLGDIQVVFERLHTVCHRNTRIIISYYSFLWEPVLNFAEAIGIKQRVPAQNWLSRNDISNLLYLAGFDVYRQVFRQIIPVNIPVISWFLNKILARLPFFRHLCITQYAFARPMLPGKDDFSVSVIVPARNESGNIEDAVKRLPAMGRHTELIFVEGNSTDDTWEKIQEVAENYKDARDIKIAKQPGKGKNDAVKTGFAMATGDILMILDADLTVPPEDLPKFYDAIASGKGDFINGSRLVYQMEKHAMQFLNVYGNKFFSMAFSWLLERPFKDTLCGTKVIFKSDYEKLCRQRDFFGDFDPFGDFDLIFGAYKLNLKIIEVPIRYRERTYGETNISRFTHGWMLLKMTAFAARKIKFY